MKRRNRAYIFTRFQQPAKRLLRFGLNAIPRRWTGELIQRVPRFVPYLDNRDVPITVSNVYYGRKHLILSNRFRIEAEVLYHHWFDQKTLLYFMRLVRPGDICIDVGANVGALTLSLAHRVGERGHVVAFEPGPLLAERLRRNLEASRCKNVRVLEIGLSDTSGTLFWKLETGANAGNAFIGSDPTDTAVPIARLDDLDAIRTLPHIDFIKIDVEGMELAAVRGAMKTIQLHKPLILLETLLGGDAQANERVAALLSLLSDAGYGFWEIDVPEDSLTSYVPEFRFIPCAYPTLPQNTLCVHRTRSTDLADNIS